MRIADVVRQERRRRAIAAALLVLVLMALACMGLAVRRARAAVRVPIEFTTPERARSYEVRARRPDNVWIALSPYADSTGTAAPTLAAPGAPQRLWTLVSEDWRAGGWLVQVRACNTVGCAEWSNAVLIAAGIPDTTWTIERGAGGLSPLDRVAWKRAARRVGWALQVGDTAAARVVHQEEVQQRQSARICELYGYWVLRGGRLACP